jgi:hypothetical protein
MLPPDKSNITNLRWFASPKDFYDDAEKLESDAEGHDTDGGTIENVGESNGTHDWCSLLNQYITPPIECIRKWAVYTLTQV